MHRTKNVSMAVCQSCLIGLLVSGMVDRAEASDGQHALDAKPILEEVTTKWTEQRRGLVSGQFRLKIYRYVNLGDAKMKREQLIQALDRVAASPDQREIGSVLDGLDTGKWAKERHTLWGAEISVTTEGIKIRNTYDQNLDGYTIAFDGANEVVMTPINKQVEIHNRTNLEKIDADSFRFLPLLDYRRLAGDFRASEDGGDVAIVGPTTEIRFDRKTGFIRDFFTRDRSGTVGFEARQYNPFATGGDLVFPKMSATIYYTQPTGEVSNLTVFSLESSVVNLPVDQNEFTLSVPVDTNIFDDRKGTAEPLHTVANIAGDPIKLIAEATEKRPNETSKVATNKSLSIVFILFNIIAVIAVAMLFRKSKLAQS